MSVGRGNVEGLRVRRSGCAEGACARDEENGRQPHGGLAREGGEGRSVGRSVGRSESGERRGERERERAQGRTGREVECVGRPGEVSARRPCQWARAVR